MYNEFKKKKHGFTDQKYWTELAVGFKSVRERSH